MRRSAGCGPSAPAREPTSESATPAGEQPRAEPATPEEKQPRGFSLHLRVGLDDPADTGQLWALLGPVAGWLAAFRGASITIEPEFSAPTMELETRGSIRVVPLRAIGIAVALAVSPAVWQGVRAMRARG